MAACAVSVTILIRSALLTCAISARKTGTRPSRPMTTAWTRLMSFLLTRWRWFDDRKTQMPERRDDERALLRQPRRMDGNMPLCCGGHLADRLLLALQGRGRGACCHLMGAHPCPHSRTAAQRSAKPAAKLFSKNFRRHG